MTIKRNDKIKNLLQQWPQHTIMTSHVLKAKGLSYSNIQNYQKSKWIMPVGLGVFKKYSDTISWEGIVHGLQQEDKHTFFVGGRTALELLGAAHFIPLKQTTIFLFSPFPKPPPLWLHKIECGVKFEAHTQRILPLKEGISPYDCGEFSIEISSRERAAIEMAALVNNADAFQELYLIFENLGSLRADILQALLEHCSSIKAKRVTLFLAYHTHHAWFQDLDLSRIDLGKGPREIVKNGIYDPSFKLTYPKGLFEDDRLEV